MSELFCNYPLKLGSYMGMTRRVLLNNSQVQGLNRKCPLCFLPCLLLLYSVRFFKILLSHFCRGIAEASLLRSKKKIYLAMKAAKGKGAAKKETKEALKPVEDRKLGKRKAAIKADQSSKKRATKKEKASKKDPNKPKRPPSAFFVFLEEFRKIYKQDHPNVKAVSAVGKAGGEKWKKMSAAEKAPYEAKAAKKKSEYEKLMSSYSKKEASIRDYSLPCLMEFLRACLFTHFSNPILSDRRLWLMMVMKSLTGQSQKSIIMRRMKVRRKRMKRTMMIELDGLC